MAKEKVIGIEEIWKTPEKKGKPGNEELDPEKAMNMKFYLFGAKYLKTDYGVVITFNVQAGEKAYDLSLHETPVLKKIAGASRDLEEGEKIGPLTLSKSTQGFYFFAKA